MPCCLPACAPAAAAAARVPLRGEEAPAGTLVSTNPSLSPSTEERRPRMSGPMPPSRTCNGRGRLERIQRGASTVQRNESGVSSCSLQCLLVPSPALFLGGPQAGTDQSAGHVVGRERYREHSGRVHPQAAGVESGPPRGLRGQAPALGPEPQLCCERLLCGKRGRARVGVGVQRPGVGSVGHTRQSRA